MADLNHDPAPAGRRLDEATKTETVGHEWDGIEELDTPLPRWWLWIFYATIVFAIGYVIAYPALPMVSKGTEGVLGWSSRGDLAKEMQAAQAQRSQVVAALAGMPIERLATDSKLMRAAVSGGEAAFKVNCVQCHGAHAAGLPGYPNLNDDDWLWGGDLKAIHQTLQHGIRHPGDNATRFSQMPAFGRDGILSMAEIADVTSFVRTLSGLEPQIAASQRGAAIFEANCAVCHDATGTGMREFGAPNLADAIWLYGGSRDEITATITNSRFGQMPAWGERLDPVTVKMLAAYVHSLGGGEKFVEVAQTAGQAAGPKAGAKPGQAGDATD